MDEVLSPECMQPSANPNGFLNCKGLLELVGIYNNDPKELSMNYRKWALRYHPDKGNGEKDFFSLVTNCVRTCSEFLEKHQKAPAPAMLGFEAILFPNIRENDRITYIDEFGQQLYGIVAQLHPSWGVEKTHIVLARTTPRWEPDQNAKKQYVTKEAMKNIQRLKAAPPAGAPPPTSFTATPSPSPVSATGAKNVYFEEVGWRELQPGDKIHVQYVNVKNPAATNSAFGIFKGAPTYSECVEFVKTDEHFNPLSRSVTIVPLTGSMCKFRRMVDSKKRKL